MNTDAFQNIEQKYIFVAQQKEMILDWLQYCYIRDPAFYFGTISSLYYDTPTLSLYDEKRNSDYLKSKVRLRWYENLQESNQAFDVKCYLEIKRKYGTVRQKERMELVISSKKLVIDPFSDEEILSLPARVYELGYFPTGILVPMLLIQYNRYRFVDAQSGARIALDTEICCTHVNATYVSGLPPVYLGAGVLEIKGRHRQLLSSLHPIHVHLTKEAFSKYARCLEYLMQPLARQV